MASTSRNSALQFMLLLGKLKSTPRTGWVYRGIPKPESIADHMYRMAAMSLLITSQTGLDKDKCVKMALVHDMAESIVGDITPHDGIDKAEKHRREEAAMAHIKTLLDSETASEIYSLWQEYESQSTAEATFVKDLDQFDMILQAYEYETAIAKPLHLDEFFQSTLGKFQHSMVRSWVDELNERRNTNKNIEVVGSSATELEKSKPNIDSV